jgi:prepilin-type N-terminal cleavage/methylation domain-containing protein
MKAALPNPERGFTILELIIATSIFLVITAAMFGLLQLSQKKYSSETQVSGAFQEARLAIDQIVRDFNVSGYPAQSLFSFLPADSSQYAASPVAWNPNYPISPCFVGTAGSGTCVTPGDFDLIVETDLGNGAGVSWIRYQLAGTTLLRAVVPKTAGPDPVAATSAPGVMVPFLTNVMNSSVQPVFQYTCDTPSGPLPCPSPAAGSSGIPNNIRDVNITLIVKTRQPDMQTGLPMLVEPNGRGHRINPSN